MMESEGGHEILLKFVLMGVKFGLFGFILISTLGLNDIQSYKILKSKN